MLNGRDDCVAVAKAYDAMGNEVEVWGGSLEKKLLVLRLQARNIINQDGTNMGSVVFADTFFQLDIAQGQETALNITKNVPALQVWQTSIKHYEHLPKPIMTEKNLDCDQLGERQNYYQDLQGLLPIKDSLQEVFQQEALTMWGVKIVFYERGFIIVD